MEENTGVFVKIQPSWREMLKKTQVRRNGQRCPSACQKKTSPLH